MVFQDLTGQKFNKLTILSHAGKNKTGQSLWLCRCECGNEKIVSAHHMKASTVKSCGCLLKSENRSNCATRHGGTDTPEWTSFHAAKKRCNPLRGDKFPDHAGRGIEFRFTSFEQFLAEIGPRPEPKFEYSLERKDNDGHYEPGNVKWATKKEQARNRRCDRCKSLKANISNLQARIRHLESLLIPA